MPADFLKQVLLNHVLDGILLTTDDTGYYTATADAATDEGKMAIFYNSDDGAEFSGDAEVIQGEANIDATNGIVHMKPYYRPTVSMNPRRSLCSHR